MSREGLFLSEQGYSRVRAAYDEMRGRSRIDALKSAPRALWDDWSSFDDLYLAIYVNRVSPEIHRGNDNYVAQIDSLKLAYKLYVLLDVDFKPFDPEGTFEDSLISEFSVVDLIHFRQAIQRILPYPLTLQHFRLGCVELEFGVWAPGESDGAALPGLAERLLANRRPWQDIVRRFKVVEQIELRRA